MTSISIHSLRIDGGTQSRAQLDEAAVADYADVIRSGGSLPPVTVYFDGSETWLADGFHRFHAHQAAGVPKIEADVRAGTRRDAILHSVGANAAHGLRRTNEDKRRAVQTLLEDAEWSAWTDREIAKACGVSHPFVAAIRDPGAAARQQENRDKNAAKRAQAVESDSTASVQPSTTVGTVESDSTPSPVESDSTQAPRAPAAAVVAAPTAPETLGSDVDEDGDTLTQLVADFEAVQSERDQLAAKVAELEERVKFLTQGDLAAEADRWKQNFEGLSNRNRDLQGKAREAQLQAKSLGDLLAKIRLALGVESSADILPALAARRAA